ncbi:MAG: nucleotidyltransferase family protein [Planctomycetota bacterium]|jgi:predicted nucleotidyltransferase
MNVHPRIPIDQSKVAQFCSKWQITEFALFGSILRDDFGPDSDVDVLVTFARDHGWSLYDVVDMEDELRSMLGRDVDLVMRGGLKNPFRRHEILRTRQVVYAA